MYYTIVLNGSTGVGSHAYAEEPDTLPENEVACTSEQAANPTAWSWNGTALVSVSPTIQQQAGALLLAGMALTSTSTPEVNGTYACDATSQQKLNGLYSILESSDEAFPSYMTQCALAQADGKFVTFTSAATLVAFLEAYARYVFTLDQIIVTGAGTVPTTNEVTIA